MTTGDLGARGYARHRTNVAVFFALSKTCIVMSRKARLPKINGGVLGQHLGLAVAVHLARSQLVSDEARGSFDAKELKELLDALGAALAKTAPLYVQDAAGAPPRRLADHELEGAPRSASPS